MSGKYQGVAGSGVIRDHRGTWNTHKNPREHPEARGGRNVSLHLHYVFFPSPKHKSNFHEVNTVMKHYSQHQTSTSMDKLNKYEHEVSAPHAAVYIWMCFLSKPYDRRSIYDQSSSIHTPIQSSTRSPFHPDISSSIHSFIYILMHQLMHTTIALPFYILTHLSTQSNIHPLASNLPITHSFTHSLTHPSIHPHKN